MTAVLNNLQSIILNCALSFWYFYINYCYSKDVNDRKAPHKKAPQWRYLQKFLAIMEKHRRICILKMRQMFFSTFAIIYVLWKLLYSTKPEQIFIISESLKKAYDKTDASLTGRLMYAYNHLPDFLKSTLEVTTFPQIVIKSTVTGVTVTMSATGPTSGRGASYDLVIVDEYAWHDRYVAADLISSLVPMAYRLWVISSPRGRNHFWKLIQDIKSGVMEGWFFWDATHEEIDMEDTQRIEIYNEIIQATPLADRAREFGGSFDDTQEGKVFPDFNVERAKYHTKLTKQQIFAAKRIGGMDEALSPDKTALILCVIEGDKLKKFFSHEANNRMPEAFIGDCVNLLMQEYDMSDLEARLVLAETPIWCDSAADTPSHTHETSTMKEYKKHGLSAINKALRLSIRDGINAIHQIISKNLFQEFYKPELANGNLITHIQNCHYPFTNAGHITSMDKYEHDSLAFSSHYMDAFRYMCVCYLRKGKLQGFEVEKEIDPIEVKAKAINPVMVGVVHDYEGNLIYRDRDNDTNLT